MPVAACIESKTKRMIARYEFNTAPNLISEQQWVDYFMQAKVPSLVDYAAVDVAMKKPLRRGVTAVATAEELVAEVSSLVVEDAVDEGVDTEVAVADRKAPWLQLRRLATLAGRPRHRRVTGDQREVLA
ncbi:Pol protein [Phytophthora cinnamomi]|nr:Pol protein [Phytophthora cinnamomi]